MCSTPWLLMRALHLRLPLAVTPRKCFLSALLLLLSPLLLLLLLLLARSTSRRVM